MAYCTADAKKEFDRWSQHYDRDWLQWFLFGPSHQMLLDTLSVVDEHILDVGCGTGVFAARVLDRFPQTRICGLDLSAGMLRQGQERYRTCADRLHVVQGDSERLPFASNIFDAITCAHSFHHYPDQARVLAEMHRVLRPGGRLLIIDGDRDGLWGRFIFDLVVVLMEGPVRHLAGHAFRDLYRATGFDQVRQHRHGGPLPFLMTVGRAVKPGRTARTRPAA